MQYRNLARSFVLGALLLAASPSLWATDEDVSEAGSGTAGARSSDNLCFGGLEDGKIIVSEPYLRNPYRETTRLGCEVDGGVPVTMPDLPAPDAARTRLT